MKHQAEARSIARVHALPGGYLAALLVGIFLSALFVYLELFLAASVIALLCATVIPLLWYTDRFVFDGRRLARTGLVPRIIARAFGVRDRLKISDIEQVETSIFPGIKRGRNILYTYRTVVSGKAVRFVFSSGHSGYRAVIRSLLPLLSEDVLDVNSLDLRDYLVDRSEVAKRAREMDIPSSDVLDGSFQKIDLQGKTEDADDEGADERSNSLRRLANELRISGRLLSALEAFRRAAVLRPRDARLLFEFAACIRSVAGSESDPKLEHRALAMMRLAERHAMGDPDLLARIGETYFQIGEWRRAAVVFKRAVEHFGESFRTVRGLAELALRDGRLAHVVHNFSVAYRLAGTTALRRWTKAEAEYFEHLSNDDEYLELEISRVNLIETLERVKRGALKVAPVGFGAIAFGWILEDYLVANVGWVLSGSCLAVWVGMILMVRLLSPRIPFDMVENDD